MRTYEVVPARFHLEASLYLQQQQRPDLSRLMQLQAAGAGLPTSIAGLPHGLGGPPPGSAAAAAAAAGAAGGLMPHGLPAVSVASLMGGLPPSSTAAVVAAAAAAASLGGIRPEYRAREAAAAAAAAAAASAAASSETDKAGLGKYEQLHRVQKPHT